MHDPCVEHFRRYLETERAASVHTVTNYLRDIEQFARHASLGPARASRDWRRPDRHAARAFLAQQRRAGCAVNTVRRKLASLRSFYRFLVREGHAASNPFGGLRAPRGGITSGFQFSLWWNQ